MFSLEKFCNLSFRAFPRQVAMQQRAVTGNSDVPTESEVRRHTNQLRRQSTSRTTSLTSLNIPQNNVKIDLKAREGEMEEALQQYFQVYFTITFIQVIYNLF